jgi:AcrR family transcriptional regulator
MERAPAHAIANFLELEPEGGRALLLSAALRCFVHNGLDGTSIRAVADAAGLTNPALYRHFASKDALAAHLFEACYTRLVARFDAALAGAPPARALEAFVGATLELLSEVPEVLVFVHEHTATLFPKMPRAAQRQRLAAQATTLAARCGLAGDDATLAGVALIGAVGHFARLSWLGALEGPSTRWRKPLEAMVQRLVGLPAARRGPPRRSRR